MTGATRHDVFVLGISKDLFFKVGSPHVTPSDPLFADRTEAGVGVSFIKTIEIFILSSLKYIYSAIKICLLINCCVNLRSNKK
jgi:hypothetical protein